MNELQKIGTFIYMVGMSDETTLNEIMSEAGKQFAASWVGITEEEKNELILKAEEGMKKLTDYFEQAKTL